LGAFTSARWKFNKQEKRLVGERWAKTTGQLFRMAEKTLSGMDVATQIKAALER
jgi:hypothetical protein